VEGAEPVTDAHQLTALRLGCEAMPGPSGWLVPDGRGVDYGSGTQLIQALLPALLAEAPGSVVFRVIGADVAVRYHWELTGPTVVVCCQGSTDALRRAVGSSSRSRRGELFLVCELPGEECSSTKLRGALQREDWDAVRRMCPGPVAEYLLAHRADLYGADPGQGHAEPCASTGGAYSGGRSRERLPRAVEKTPERQHGASTGGRHRRGDQVGQVEPCAAPCRGSGCGRLRRGRTGQLPPDGEQGRG